MNRIEPRPCQRDRRGPPGKATADGAFHPPEQTRIDLPLVAGAALFGIGWGMSGICPGPAIALVAFLPANLGIFLLALLIGSWLGGLLTSRTRSAMPMPVPAE